MPLWDRLYIEKIITVPGMPTENYTCKVKITDDDNNISVASTSFRVNMFKLITNNASIASKSRSFVFNNMIWNWGNADHLLTYTPDFETWFEVGLPPGLVNSAGNSIFEFNNKIWIFKYNGIWNSEDGKNWVQVTSDAACLRHGRQSYSINTFNNKIWVIGGDGANGFLNDVWYSLDGIEWVQATDSAAFLPREGHTSFVYDNKMWVIGGKSKVYYNDVWCSSDGIIWKQISKSAAFTPRRYHSSCVYENKMWVIGGEYLDLGWAKSMPSSDVWYSQDGLNWIKAISNTSPKTGEDLYPVQGHSTVVFDNKIWVIGGYNVCYTYVWNSTLKSN